MIQDDPTVIAPILQELKKNQHTLKKLPLDFRKKQLQQLVKGVNEMSQQFHEALNKDIGASHFYSEIFSTKISTNDIQHTISNFKSWAQTKKVDTSMLVGPAFSYIKPEPFGVALVISAWNYPVYTALPPVASAIAAGNCVVLKPSEMAPHTSNVLKALFEKYLDPQYYRVIEGGFQVASQITANPFDVIVFTGSPEKGKLVAKAAAENLIPCVLELGGKSPTIVDSDAGMENAALRIAQGRYLNAGQTCVACDYVYVHSSIKEKFVKTLIEKIREFYGQDAQQSADYIKIVNENHTKRLQSYLQDNHGGEVAYGGRVDIQGRFVEPTVVLEPKKDSKMMQDEIFGPILPVYTYDDIDEVISFINSRPKPLALYYFGYKNKDKIMDQTSSGAFSQNEALFHLGNSDLPFGGVQNSGFGACHGVYGFEGCSHMKPIFIKAPLNIFPYNARYPPYTEGRKKVLSSLYSIMNVSQASVFKAVSFIAFMATIYYYRKGRFDNYINQVSPYISETYRKVARL